jgi:hypothetical protein
VPACWLCPQIDVIEEVETGKVGRTVPSEPEIEKRKRRGRAVLLSAPVAELSLTNHRSCADTVPYPADLHIIPGTHSCLLTG